MYKKKKGSKMSLGALEYGTTIARKSFALGSFGLLVIMYHTPLGSVVLSAHVETILRTASSGVL